MITSRAEERVIPAAIFFTKEEEGSKAREQKNKMRTQNKVTFESSNKLTEASCAWMMESQENKT